MNVLRGPWCDSIIVQERRIAARFTAMWPRLSVLPDAEIAVLFARAGFDDDHTAYLLRILRRHHVREQGAA